MNQPQLKTINIRGKEYSPVESRIAVFHQRYPRGVINTKIIESSAINPAEWVFMSATVIPDIDKPERFFTGHSQAKWQGSINGQAALENAETSAIGRALAALGLAGGASYDEMVKCGAAQAEPLAEPEVVNSEKIVPLERPASSLKASEACEMIEKWMIENPQFKGGDIIGFLVSKKYQFDQEDVGEDPLCLPENVLKELASKLPKLAPALKKFLAQKV